MIIYIIHISETLQNDFSFEIYKLAFNSRARFLLSCHFKTLLIPRFFTLPSIKKMSEFTIRKVGIPNTLEHRLYTGK
jgi:hypothetical protein